MAYKSKCKSCKVCCIEVIRDTEAEIELDEMVVNRQPILPPSPSGNNIESNNNDIEINKPFSDKI